MPREGMFWSIVVNEMYSYICLRVFPVKDTLKKLYHNRRHYHCEKIHVQ